MKTVKTNFEKLNNTQHQIYFNFFIELKKKFNLIVEKNNIELNFKKEENYIDIIVSRLLTDQEYMDMNSFISEYLDADFDLFFRANKQKTKTHIQINIYL